MKTNNKIILIAIIAVAVGISIGYFLFGNKSKNTADITVNNQANLVTDDKEIWTCSMHPQIRQNEPGDCPLCGMDLIPLDENSSDDPLLLKMTDEAVKLANIQTTIIGEDLNQKGKTIQLYGKVKADERLASTQVAHVPGRIEKLFVSYTGEKVLKGQKLASLYSPELISAQRELLEAVKLKEINPGLLIAARNKLRYLKIKDTVIEAIEQQDKIEESFIIYADETGIVTNKRVSVGDYVKLGEPLFDLMNLDKVWVLFDAYEEDLKSINIGDNIKFTTPSIPNKSFKTRISFIDPVINPITRVASIRTEINNYNGMLKPEMFAQGILQNKSLSNSKLSIPKSSVLWTGLRSVVYVKVQDTDIPSFQYRAVEIGESLGDTYQLISGLNVGDEVVTYGSFTIDAAAQLNNQASMINKNVMLKTVDHTLHLPDYTETTPVKFKQQLENVSNEYLLLKDALVLTDMQKASLISKKLIEALSKVDMSLLMDDAHLYWMDQLGALNAHANKIAELNNIKEQREQFDFLSEVLINSVKVFGLSNQVLYVEYCPMALGNKGANWLSREPEIRNPYFGDKMLKCGLVKDTITKDYKNPQWKKQ